MEKHDAETWFLHCKRPVYTNYPNVRLVLAKQASIWNGFYIVLTLYKMLRREKPDVIITYTHYANIIGAVIAYFAGVKKRIVSQRNPSFSYPVIARILDRLIGSTLIYHKNICVSHHVFDSFSDYPEGYKNKLAVVYNGIDFSNSEINQKEARVKFDLPVDGTILITTGRLSYQKNHEFLINVMVGLADNIHLAIAGEGELRPQLEAQIESYGLKGRVHLIGEIKPDIIPIFLKAGDVFLFPSRFEAFGFSLVEAMASGLPVVVNDIPALRYIVSDYGMVIPVDKKEDWMSIIFKLKDDLNSRYDYGQRALDRSADFALKNMVEGYLEYAH